MVDEADDNNDFLLTFIHGVTWLLFAAAFMVAAGWGAYYRLGGIDTPLQKASVVGASLVGLGVAIYLNKIARIVVYALIVVVLIWGANYWWHHK
jgi:hypothetical protein